MRYSRPPGGITMSTGGWITLAVAVALVLFAIAVYNRLVVLRNRFKNAFSQIDVQLKRRYDLIPNLVESVKGYLQHERQTLEAVTKARGDAVSAGCRKSRSASLDFFERQEQARRTTRWLVFWYALAVLSVVASFCLVAALFRPPLQIYVAIAALVGGCILAVSAYRIWQLSEGGEAVAALLGARYVDPWKCSPAERRLLNVVEEMAIASGISVPPVYLLERETAINALVAGHAPHQAVIIVTHGAVQQLSREELQGVMGHEFSHILNGDMALNLRLVGILAGLTWFSEQGEKLVYRAAWQARAESST